MAFSRPSFGFSNQTTLYSPNKSKHDYWSRCCSKTYFTILSKQTINLPENVKSKEGVNVRHGEAVEKVKRALMTSNAEECLFMVDSIQRLGIEHHFEHDIAATLENKYLQTRTSYDHHHPHRKLSRLALQFRLLRQQGYYVHTDVFDEYRNTKGELKHTSLYEEDIDGFMALFEASQLSIPGEHFLDEAGLFSRQYLCSIASRFHDHPQAKSIQHTLRFPIHRTLPRFIPQSLQLNGNAPWTTSLQELSQMDTQLLNSLHLKEIAQVSKWWKDLGLAKELKFVRDEPIKWYMWPMACLPDPRFSRERIDLTKPLSLIYIIDDIFDCYGSIHELTLFTHAVQRWDLAAMEELPECMKVCFKALYEVTNEFAFKIYTKHGLNPISTLVKSWVRLCNAFLEEAKWFESGKSPSAEEYLKNGRVSTGVHVILVHIFFSMGQGLTDHNVALMNEFPTIISTLSTILRLCDDLEGDNDVKKDGTDGSYMNCYVKDHPGVSIEETRKHIKHRISEEWKRLNQELVAPENQLPSCFVRVCFNAARMVPLMYSYDGDTPSMLEEHVKSLFCNADNLRATPPQHQSNNSKSIKNV